MDENTINMEEFACASPSAGNSFTVPNNGSSAEKKMYQNIVGVLKCYCKEKKWNMCRYWWKIRTWDAVQAGTSAILDQNKLSWVMQHRSGCEEWTSTGRNSCSDWSQKCINIEALTQYKTKCITKVKVFWCFVREALNTFLELSEFCLELQNRRLCKIKTWKEKILRVFQCQKSKRVSFGCVKHMCHEGFLQKMPKVGEIDVTNIK